MEALVFGVADGVRLVYGKIFRQIYDSTLADDWQALITFQQFLILCDPRGVVDMTAAAIHRITGIPIEHIEAGIEKLEQPDPQSRSTVADGRRIIRLEDSRSWGWQIVNYAYYQNLVNREDKREKDRIRIAEKRSKDKDVADCRDMSPEVANVAPVSVTVTTSVKNPNPIVPQAGLLNDFEPRKPNGLAGQALEVLQFLNDKTGRKFRGLDGRGRPTPNLKFIMERLKSGVTVQDCKTVVARKYRDWSGDDKMWAYVRPETLFNATKFEQYLGECTTTEKRNSE